MAVILIPVLEDATEVSGEVASADYPLFLHIMDRFPAGHIPELDRLDCPSGM
jgi:hypothetical protein